jgi:hypothetical protein
MAECAAASKPSHSLTVLLYDRVRLLDRLGRHDEALAQPEEVMARQAVGISAFSLLIHLMDRKNDLQPLFKQRAEFLAAETSTLGREPLSEIKVAP